MFLKLFFLKKNFKKKSFFNKFKNKYIYKNYSHIVVIPDEIIYYKKLSSIMLFNFKNYFYFGNNKYSSATYLLDKLKIYNFIEDKFWLIHRFFFYRYFIKLDWLVLGIFELVFQHNFKKFSFLLKLLFFQIPVPKHRFLLLFFRRIFRKFYLVFSKVKLVTSVSFLFKGKLSVTGNKRTRRFKKLFGYIKLPNNYLNHFTIIRTNTGVIGFWLHIEF